MAKYDHNSIEKKWQKYWLDNKIFEVKVDPSKPKFYVLDMFPYPSGAGLHVGHVVGYTATDIYSRYKRQRGFNVLHPMGWDSFGLPAEQYAIRTGTHPAITTQANIDTYRRQLRSLGFSYDWNREIATSDATYYKWTQWIFTVLYQQGMAYEAEMMVNYCPALGTVLANEEVDAGRSKEGGHPVERRPLRQWVLKITAYADRLIQDLDLLDWPDSLKKLQINWIGKSEGALVDFTVKSIEDSITVFTTRADTLFGATFMVLAPEHPLVDKITSAQQREKVKSYQKEAAAKSDLDRTDLSKHKIGVFTGAYATNPVNGEQIPIWISDYVLMGYGTGAIMAVPGHDERDFEFATEYNLPVKAIMDPDLDSYPDLLPPNITSPKAFRELVLAGKACWTGEGKYIHSQNSEISLEGKNLEEAKKTVSDWLAKKGTGKSATTYKLRDWLFSRQRYWGEPFPILHFADGTKRVLGVDELPLCPPSVDDYKPTGDGKSPLAKVTDWVEIIDPKTGKPALRETNTMPQWAGSCWYYLRFMDPHNDMQAWSEKAENYWKSVDLYVGGAEHAVLHLLYARFWHKVLFDAGYVTTPEPFMSLRNQGLVLARSYQTANRVYVSPEDVIEKEGKFYHRTTNELLTTQIDKMSKSKLNGVTPDEIIEEFGADALRLYEMFMGPLEKEKIWNTDAVSGCSRFLARFYDMATSDKVSDDESVEASKLGHRAAYGVMKDIEALQFNTAIAKMMEFMNDFTRLPSYPRSVIKMVTQALMPFAPHLAEEIWEMMGCKEVLATHPYPEIDEKFLQDESVTYVVQVNGKLRGRFELPKDQTQEVVFEAAKKNPTIAKFLEQHDVEKIIFVPNRILNIVLK